MEKATKEFGDLLDEEKAAEEQTRRKLQIKESNLNRKLLANLKLDAPELMDTGTFLFHDDESKANIDNIQTIESLAETAGVVITNGVKQHRRNESAI